MENIEKTYLDSLYADKYLLENLQNQIFIGNIDFVDFGEILEDVDSQQGLDKDYIRQRIFYNHCLGNLQINDVSEKDYQNIIQKCKNKGISTDNILIDQNGILFLNKLEYFSHFLEVKITKEGLQHISVLDDLIRKNKGLKKYLTKISETVSQVSSYKLIFTVILTGLFVLVALVSDIKVSEYIEKMPLIGSIVDSDFIKQFESVDESDQQYQEFKQNMSKITQELKINQNEIKDIKYKQLSPDERVYKIRTNDGQDTFVNVKRTANTYEAEKQSKEIVQQTVQNVQNINILENNKIIFPVKIPINR